MPTPVSLKRQGKSLEAKDTFNDEFDNNDEDMIPLVMVMSSLEVDRPCLIARRLPNWTFKASFLKYGEDIYLSLTFKP
jgi:hypothetical protein